MQPEETTTGPPENRRRESFPWLQWASLALALTITALIVAFRNRASEFASYGYLGLFVVSIVGNATVLLPLPSLVTTMVVGSVLNPWWVGLVSGAGMAIGEISGYLAGYGGTAIIDTNRREIFRHLERWMQRRGFLTLVVLAVIPNPLFDLAGIAAGMTRFPFWKFLLAALLGKSIKGLLFAFAGAGALPWLERWLP
jgi:membrane protein YqaA with SNARE-associated domain